MISGNLLLAITVFFFLLQKAWSYSIPSKCLNGCFECILPNTSLAFYDSNSLD